MTAATEIDRADAIERLSILTDHHAWWSRIVEDGVLRVEFGPPRLSIRQDLVPARTSAPTSFERRVVHPEGRWSLFVGTGLWRIEQGDAIIERSQVRADTFATYGRRSLCALDGQTWAAARWRCDEWQFDFDLGSTISIAADPTEDENEPLTEQWTLFSASGGSITCTAAGRIVVEDPF